MRSLNQNHNHLDLVPHCLMVACHLKSWDVYSLQFAWLQGETVLEHVGPWFRAHLIHSSVTRISFQEREKNSQHHILWRVYRYISWSTITSRPAPQGLILMELKFANFLLDRQTAKLKTLPNFSAIGMQPWRSPTYASFNPSSLKRNHLPALVPCDDGNSANSTTNCCEITARNQ